MKKQNMKTESMKTLSITIPAEVYLKLNKISESKGISISDLSINILERYTNIPDYDQLLEEPTRHYEQHERMRLKLKELSHRVARLEIRRMSTTEPELNEESTKEDESPEKSISPEKQERNTLPLSEIVISDKFLETPPRKEKVQEAVEEYKKCGSFEKPVVVRKKDMILIDGYKRYIAAKELGLEEIKVKLI